MRVQREATFIRVETPAKLNLFFEVLGKRIDGFHEIETLMVPIGLYDSLTFTPHSVTPQCFRPRGGASAIVTATTSCSGAAAPGTLWPPPSADTGLPMVEEIAIDCRWAGSLNSTTSLGTLPPSAGNLATRAAILLRSRAGVAVGATIRLLKRIPSAAGLGGGSSDAAATLVAGNLAWRIHWPLVRLMELAAELGSDVPFFLTRGAAICRGRGERVESLGNTAPLHAVVVRPPQGLSTAEVYARCVPGAPRRSVEPLVAALRRGDFRQIGRGIFNRLEQPAAELSAWIGRLRREFSRLDCTGAQMSGSGTSFFGICRHALHARRVAGQLRARGLGHVYAVQI